MLSGKYPLHVETTGDDRRPALLLLNPLGTTLDFWEPLVYTLGHRNWLIRFDWRGHGGSLGDPVSSYEIADLADDARTVLDALEVQRAHVFGSSLGGLVALDLAAKAPDRVDRLVLASTALRMGSNAWWIHTMDQVLSLIHI